MKVAVDVTPLEQTRAGTARYLRALLPRVERTVTVERMQRLRRAARPGRSGSTSRGTRTCCRTRARGADVLHCPTYRAPGSQPRPGRRHGARPRRLPPAGGVPAVDAHVQPARRPARRRATRRIVAAVSEFTANEVETLLGVPRERIRVVPNAVEPSFAADGPRADGDYVLAVGTLEPRKNLARVDRGGAAARPRAARRRRARAGAASRRAAPASRGSAFASRRRARAALPRRALRRLPVALRGLRHPGARGDGVRRAGRHVAPAARRRRSPAARRCSSTRRTSRRSPPGSRRRSRAATSCAPLGLRAGARLLVGRVGAAARSTRTGRRR